MLDLDRIKILMDSTNAVIFGFAPQGTSYHDSKRIWYALEALVARVKELEAEREVLRAALQDVITYDSTGTDEEVAAWRVARELLGDWTP